MESVCKIPFSFLPFLQTGAGLAPRDVVLLLFAFCGVAGTVGEKIDVAVGGMDLVNVGGFWQCVCL